jgi:hypothetical protein
MAIYRKDIGLIYRPKQKVFQKITLFSSNHKKAAFWAAPFISNPVCNIIV